MVSLYIVSLFYIIEYISHCLDFTLYTLYTNLLLVHTYIITLHYGSKGGRLIYFISFMHNISSKFVDKDIFNLNVRILKY